MQNKKAGLLAILRFTGSLFIYQAVTSVMTFFMFMGVIPFFHEGLWQALLVSGVPSIVIYSMSYLDAWKYGSKLKGANGSGKGLINIGALRLDAAVGALIFELISFVFYALFVFFEQGWATVVFLFLRYNFYAVYYIFDKTGGWLYFIPFLFLLSPLLALLGFNLGSRDISITERLKYGKNKK